MPSHEMISFSNSYVYFGVPAQDPSQIQRMTIGSVVAYEGAGAEAEWLVLCDDLLGGRVYDPHQLIQTPTYGYRLIYSRNRYAIYREYSPPKSSGSDEYGVTQDLFTDSWMAIKSGPSRQIVDESQIRRAVASGAPVNAVVSATASPDGRRCYLQFPIRYFSVRGRPSVQFHAEGGPILVPKSMCGEGESESAESMYVAQIGFNCWSEAEIAIWSGPTSEFGSARSFRDIRKIKADLSFIVDYGVSWP